MIAQISVNFQGPELKRNCESFELNPFYDETIEYSTFEFKVF